MKVIYTRIEMILEPYKIDNINVWAVSTCVLIHNNVVLT